MLKWAHPRHDKHTGKIQGGFRSQNQNSGSEKMPGYYQCMMVLGLMRLRWRLGGTVPGNIVWLKWSLSLQDLVPPYLIVRQGKSLESHLGLSSVSKFLAKMVLLASFGNSVLLLTGISAVCPQKMSSSFLRWVSSQPLLLLGGWLRPVVAMLFDYILRSFGVPETPAKRAQTHPQAQCMAQYLLLTNI